MRAHFPKLRCRHGVLMIDKCQICTAETVADRILDTGYLESGWDELDAWDDPDELYVEDE